ncbi:PREDICTED: intestinal mucin-like protein [Tauraco erythrolophus]|uniref:intestinal mucin-like protein n=1 Tax=Tauraco erythrolophus TaxID=121530 RepID=UPI0005237575|nr:PREDICTED: intestinal mucin-like protein [Tauraco erythrolophus]
MQTPIGKKPTYKLPVQIFNKGYCTGWGDPHYLTFDGLYYSYQGNCTYVLVEEIDKKVDNFGVYIDNYHCDARDVVSCPRTLIVRHETQEVRMATVEPNTLQVEVLENVTVNKQKVSLPYKKFGVSIYESGINRVVEIPELKMNVTYNGLSFSIRMPYSLFGNNTHGHVFEPCHNVVQPQKYYEACFFDSCKVPNLDLECSSLQIYAATCADQGVCIDWRSHTNGLCCKYLIVYLELLGKLIWNCFSNNALKFGEEFMLGCQDCVCLEGENGIVCQTHECAEQNKTSCDGEGFYEVNEFNSEDSCCPIVTCKCNTSLCTAKAPKCTLGFEVYSHIPSGQCCPVYQCVAKGVCVHQNAEFLPNSSVFIDKCQNCFCTNEVNVSTELNIISCEHVPCDTYCEPPGEFQNDPDNNCTIYSCLNISNQLISSTSEITCPAFNEESCKPVTHSVDEGKAVEVVYLDFSKAFDTISDSILLEKL